MQINLLPWREQERQVKQIAFGIMMASCVIGVIFIVILGHIYFRAIIDQQKKTNAFLTAELQIAQNSISDLKEKKTDQLNLIARLHFLINLRQESYNAVSLLDTLARTTPSSIVLNKVVRVGNSVQISGVAQSDPDVTVFIKNLASVKGIKEAVLSGIVNVQGLNGDERHFEIKLTQE